MKKRTKAVVVAVVIVGIAAVSLISARGEIFAEKFPAMGGAGAAGLQLTTQ